MPNYKVSIVDKGRRCCYLCGSTHNLEIHHIFNGSNRKLSTRYGLVVTLCAKCHRGIGGVHNDYSKMEQLKKVGQKAFEKEYPTLDFLKIFHRNYLGDEDDDRTEYCYK